MQRYIIITACLIGLLTSYSSFSAGSEAPSQIAHVEYGTQDRCEDLEAPSSVNFTKPDVIKTMKPFVIREIKNNKIPLIQKTTL
tara:strand:+ start:485 stop:736 length:252 start_codon:yes stop_codon:yes gene_type:complete